MEVEEGDGRLARGKRGRKGRAGSTPPLLVGLTVCHEGLVLLLVALESLDGLVELLGAHKVERLGNLELGGQALLRVGTCEGHAGWAHGVAECGATSGLAAATEGTRASMQGEETSMQ